MVRYGVTYSDMTLRSYIADLQRLYSQLDAATMESLSLRRREFTAVFGSGVSLTRLRIPGLLLMLFLRTRTSTQIHECGHVNCLCNPQTPNYSDTGNHWQFSVQGGGIRAILRV